MDKSNVSKNEGQPFDDLHRASWLPLLSDYIDEALTASDKIRLRQHLDECAPCTADLAGLQSVVVNLQHLPELAVPRSFGLTPAQARRLRPSPVFRFAQVAAAIAAVFLLVTVAFDGFGTFQSPVLPTSLAINSATPTSTPDPNIGTLPPAATRPNGGSNTGQGAVISDASPTATPANRPAEPVAMTTAPALRWTEIALAIATVLLIVFALSLRPRAPGRIKHRQ